VLRPKLGVEGSGSSGIRERPLASGRMQSGRAPTLGKGETRHSPAAPRAPGVVRGLPSLGPLCQRATEGQARVKSLRDPFRTVHHIHSRPIAGESRVAEVTQPPTDLGYLGAGRLAIGIDLQVEPQVICTGAPFVGRLSCPALR
jgi:hypothetical protein